MKKVLFIILIFITTIFSCTDKEGKTPEISNKDINKVISRMTDLMIHDVTNPCLAARFFSYACLSGYEVIALNDPKFRSMHKVLKEFPKIEAPKDIKNISANLSAVIAMMETAKKMQPSGSSFEKFEQDFLDSCSRLGFDDVVMENSKAYGIEVSKQILKYVKTDKYNRISNYARYTPSEEEGSWYPTPPGYFAPVEPHFNTIRSFTLDTCSQFKPEPPAPFSKDKNSLFYKMAQETYNIGGKGLTKEYREIAAFWDCNPFALNDNGHLMVGMKKISPGAHWLGITGIACEKANKSFAESMKIYTSVSIGLMDGFITCWDEKFRSNRIRPETAIRKYIDPEWEPLLQTPPFPEYLSGHSTISTASAVILTHYFGDNFKYTDTVEEKFGLGKRSFNSFHDAAKEAAISRLYGGIHFRDGIENGITQGASVGNWVLNKIEGKKESLVAVNK